MMVCQTEVLRPTCRGVHSPVTTRVERGRAHKVCFAFDGGGRFRAFRNVEVRPDRAQCVGHCHDGTAVHDPASGAKVFADRDSDRLFGLSPGMSPPRPISRVNGIMPGSSCFMSCSFVIRFGRSVGVSRPVDHCHPRSELQSIHRILSLRGYFRCCLLLPATLQERHL